MMKSERPGKRFTSLTGLLLGVGVLALGSPVPAAGSQEPFLVTAPTLSGLAQVGQTLTATEAVWKAPEWDGGRPLTGNSWGWNHCTSNCSELHCPPPPIGSCSFIGGALQRNSQFYTITTADVGFMIRVCQGIDDSIGPPVPPFGHHWTVGACSNPTAVVTAASTSPPPTTPPPTTPTPPPPPTVANVAQSNPTWSEGNKLASFSRNKRPPIGTTFSFALNEQARVSFAFTQQIGGRKVEGKCVAQTDKNRHNPVCKRTVTRGTLSFTGHSGVNKVVFQGRISRSKKLELGRYTLLIIATTATGQRSQPRSLSFTIVK